MFTSRAAVAVLIGVIGTSLTSNIVVPVQAATQPPDFTALLAERPYVPLFSEANNCAENRSVNELTGAQLEARLAEIARAYVHVHGEASNQFLLGEACRGTSPSTLASKLSARGLWTSNYRNGSYVSQATTTQVNAGEAADLEATAPLSIATFWPGNAKPYVMGDDTNQAARLSVPVGVDGTTVQITSAAASRPTGAPTTWPYVSSRGSGLQPGAHSANTHDFVSWVRIDDELMQVTAPPVESGGVVTLTVVRGLWGTPTVAHGAGQRVMSPVYIGSTSAVSSDANLAGAPNRDSTSAGLRYGIKIWQPGGHNWIASRIKATFGGDLQGYNSVWLDVSSCAQYNNSDASGQPVAGWDDPLATKLGRDRWGAHQKTKLAGLRAAFPGVRFAGNNLGSNFNVCTDDLLGNAYDGGVLEHWMKSDAAWSLDWAASMGQNLKIQANDWPALYWVRWNYDYSGDPAQYKRFSYGSLLLARQPTAVRSQYGGAWGMARPDDLYFWNWGTPAGTPATISELAVAGTGLYRRTYSNGTVFVNPGTASVTYALDGTYYDVVNKDLGGQPIAVTSVTIGPKDAAFLLRSAATPEPPPDTTSTTTTPPTTTPPDTTSTTTTSTTTTSTTTTPPTTTAPDTTAPDTTAPDTSVSAPTEGQAFSGGPVTVRGTATDGIGVTGVRLAFQDLGTGKWWQPDGTWSTTRTSVPATLDQASSPSTSWSYVWPSSRRGSYAVEATAGDGAGNHDASPARRKFRLKHSVLRF